MVYTMEEAERLVKKAVEASTALLSVERFDEAEALLVQAMKTGIESYDVLVLLSLVKNHRGLAKEAESLLLRAVEINPNLPNAYSDLSLCYGSMRDYSNSLKYAKEAVRIAPDQLPLMNNLGLAYRASGLLEQAEKVFLWCKEKSSEDVFVLVNLATVYSDMLKFDIAEKYLNDAIVMSPQLQPAYVNLAYIQLLRGDYVPGFLNYERRFKTYGGMQFYVQRYGMDKMWDSVSDLNGKRVIVYGEQGQGDVLQFSRYIPRLKARYPDASIFLSCSLQLARIFDSIEGYGLDGVINKQSAILPEFDYHFPTMSMPLLLQDYGRQLEHKLVVEPCRFGGENLKVGLCWKGSDMNKYDSRRSIPLAKFFSLTQTPDVDFYGLQYDHKEHAGVKALGIQDLMDGVDDFYDTAKLIAGLDLVITVDTAVLHLAGMVGTPTWALIGYKPDWRWGLDSETTDWYPSVRLFRQKNPGDWDTVLDRVQGELTSIKSVKNHIYM